MSLVTFSALAVALLLTTALLQSLPAWSALWRTRILVTGTLLASLSGLLPAVAVLGGTSQESLRVGSFMGQPLSLGMDPLSAFFMCLLLFILPLIVLVGVDDQKQAPGSETARQHGWWLLTLAASVVVVLLAEGALVLLMAWEIMALTSFFLVVETNTRASRRAGWIYLIASHAGSACLLMLFLFLASVSGSWSFSAMATLHPKGEVLAWLYFAGTVGFGVKAGFLPLHIWLPETYPAAPPHTSAFLSGVLSKTGIYGILRLFFILGAPPLNLGWVLLTLGIATALYGIIAAMPQHDIKRLLAYSSVENIGIILIGIGLAAIGNALGSPLLALLALAGALLHTLNHAVFKSLLFIGAGIIIRATGTSEIDRLGGLLKRMPWTGACMIVGCVSIAAIPPFNGFLGEFLIYLAAFQEAPRFHGWNALPATLTLGSLALTGGLALATFTKLFGTVFLGEPRTDAVINAKDPQGSPRFILLALALLCPAIMLLAPWLVPLAINVAASIFPRANDYSLAIAAYPGDAITGIVTVSLILTTATILLLALRQYLYRGRDVATACTWDCGFAGSSPRVQYTGSSFTAPISALFNSLFRVEERVPHIQDLFPESSSYTARTPDVITRHIYQRGFHALERVSSKIIRLQAGRVHLYIAYIVITLLAILAWKLG